MKNVKLILLSSTKKHQQNQNKQVKTSRLSLQQAVITVLKSRIIVI